MLRVFCALLLVSEAFAGWSWRNPYPFGEALTSVVFARKQFFAAGNNIILTSSNGTDWVEHITPTVSGPITSIVYAKKCFVGTTPEDFVFSENGIDWFWRRGLPGRSANNMTYAGGQLVSVNLHALCFSRDGEDWSRRYSTVVPAEFSALAYGQNQFVIVGQGGTILRFTNPQYLYAVPPVGRDLQDVDFISGQFVALARSNVIYSSSNAYFWTKKTIPYDREITSIKKVHGRVFVAPTGDQLINRSRILESTFSRPVESVTDWAYGKGKFVGVGLNGTIISSKRGNAWNVHSGGPQIYVQDFAAKDGVIIAVGASLPPYLGTGGLMWSTTGLWTRVTSVTQDLFAATVFAGHFFAVGKSGVILKSSDGINWTTLPSPVTNALRSLACAPDKIVAVGDGGIILNSLDGDTWHAEQISDFDWTSIAYGKGRFVVMGPLGGCTSDEGLSWTMREISGLCVDFGDNRFVVTRDQGTLHSSSNGIDWDSGIYLPSTFDKIAVASSGILGTEKYGRVQFFGSASWQLLSPWSYVRRYSAVRYIDGVFYVGGESGRVFSGTPDL